MNKIPVVEKGTVTDKGYSVSKHNPEWLEWLNSNKSFRYEPSQTEKGFTVRKERSEYWYGYRKISGELHKVYIGKSDELSVELLEEGAYKLNNPTPRKEKPEASVTEYVTKSEVEELRGELQALREEMQSLVKPKAR